MTARTGTTITCDRYDCQMTMFGDTEQQARERAETYGWTRSEDGRDFCLACTEVRAQRKPLRELVPEGVRLMEVFDAARAAGFTVDESKESDAEVVQCCGQPVDIEHFIGSPYYAKCKTCDNAIASVLGPTFGNSWVAVPDSDKLDTEDPCQWVIVREWAAAAGQAVTS